MGKEKRPTLIVVYAPQALRELDQIWNWNQEHYSADHADKYAQFLDHSITVLRGNPWQGNSIDVRPELYYLRIQRRPSRHGHVAVYAIRDRQIDILHIFHTAQDWQTKLKEETDQG